MLTFYPLTSHLGGLRRMEAGEEPLAMPLPRATRHGHEQGAVQLERDAERAMRSDPAAITSGDRGPAWSCRPTQHSSRASGAAPARGLLTIA